MEGTQQFMEQRWHLSSNTYYHYYYHSPNNTLQFTHVLGINSDMMKYYRDANTGEPLTPRPFAVVDDTATESLGARPPCAPDGTPPDPRRPVVLPSCNTVRSTVDSRGWHSWNVVLPTVTQVARNQFHCQTLEGVALENQPTNPLDCFGSHFDEVRWSLRTIV